MRNLKLHFYFGWRGMPPQNNYKEKNHTPGVIVDVVLYVHGRAVQSLEY